MLSIALFVATQAPDFNLQALDGSTVSLGSTLQEGPCVVVFWATWCTYCKELLDLVNEMYGQYRDQGLRALAITQDSPRSKSKVASLVSGRGWEFPVLFDPDKSVSRSWRVVALPTLFVVSQDGQITFQRIGFSPGQEEELRSKIKEALGL